MQTAKERKHKFSKKRYKITEDQNLVFDQSKVNIHKKKKYNPSKSFELNKKKVKKKNSLGLLGQTNVKHANCVSNYIGPERLTNRVGFLTKGKISDSISRFEKAMPEELRARANQDLHQILKFSSKDETNLQSSFCKDNSSMSISSKRTSGVSSSDSDHSPMRHAPRNVFKHRKKILKPSDTKDVQSTSNVFVEESHPIFSQDELSVSAETITNKLYNAISCANKLIFPNISYQEALKKDLLNIKKQYDYDKKTPSNSSNCESSQDVLKASTDNFELNPILTQEECLPKVCLDKFELNPILTQTNDVQNSLVDIFPNDESYSSSSIEDDNSSLSVKSNANYNDLRSKSPLSDFERKPGRLIKFSSSSSNGTPVWVPVVSPLKFVPNFPPTPKIYFRQKMF